VKRETELKLEQARRNLALKGVDFHTTFGTPSGKKVLDQLTDEFDQSVLCKNGMTDHDVVVRAAQRDVIQYIKMMITYRDKENEDV
jgi:hypothetical protein